MRLFIASILVLVATVASGQDRLVLKGDVIEEQEHDRTLISKPGWLRGVHIIGTTPASVDAPQLLSVLPANWTQFCGKVTSIGGDYSATVEFTPDNAADLPREAALSFDTEFEFPVAATHETGGVVLEQGACVDSAVSGDVRRFMASFWNVAAQPKIVEGHAQLVMNMNVARAERLEHIAFLDNEANALRVSCEKLTVANALAFNYRCTVYVPEAWLPMTAETPISFSYSRFYRGRLSEPRTAEIFVGADQ